MNMEVPSDEAAWYCDVSSFPQRNALTRHLHCVRRPPSAEFRTRCVIRQGSKPGIGGHVSPVGNLFERWLRGTMRFRRELHRKQVEGELYQRTCSQGEYNRTDAHSSAQYPANRRR